ncbi:MAG: hypothetical protein GYB65_21590 [Chloroflexi bacterium]|nr:hypothetical protein [Chloroflexota bacterium]
MTSNEESKTVFEDVKINIKTKLSALWAAFMFLYVYDVLLSLYEPGRIEELMTGSIDGVEFTPELLFGSAILITIPSLMVFLALILKPAVNRWVNIVLGIVYILVNITNVLSSPNLWAYLFVFYIIEGVLSALIVWHAWRWPTLERRPESSSGDLN